MRKELMTCRNANFFVKGEKRFKRVFFVKVLLLAFKIRNSGTVARFSNSKFRYSCALFKFEIQVQLRVYQIQNSSTVARFSNSKFRYSCALFKFEIQVQLRAFQIRYSPIYIFTFRNQECWITRPHIAYKCRIQTLHGNVQAICIAPKKS